MKRFNTIPIALCAVITFVMTLVINVYAEQLTPLVLYDRIDGNNTCTVEDGDWFPANAVFPPDADEIQGREDLDAGTYTLLFPEGISVTFVGSLTILEDEGAIGRIVAQGNANNMIAFTSAEAGPAAGDWGRITIATDPAGGNILEFFEIFITTPRET